MDHNISDDAGPIDPAGSGGIGGTMTAREIRLRAAAAAARFFGVEIDINDYRGPASEPYPQAAALAAFITEQGLVARAMIFKWRNLMGFDDSTPIVMLLRDGTAAMVVGADPSRNLVWIKSPTSHDAESPVAVDRLRLEQAWAGEVILVRRGNLVAENNEPFTLGWLMRTITKEKKFLRQIFFASLVLAILGLVPAFLVMGTLNRVLEYGSVSTFWMLVTILVTMMFFETVMGWARRELITVLAAKLDTQLHLYLFSRTLSLSLDFFERSQAGETIGKLMQMGRVREFLTGRLLTTLLDAVMLLIFLPVLFYLEPLLGAVTLATAGVIALIIMAFLRPVGQLVALFVRAEHRKSAVLTETLQGIRTVKTLALEPQRKSLWDERVAEAASWRMAASRMGNWPQTLTDPFSMFLNRGIVLLGAYLALQANSQVDRGGLIAFMMLSGRVAQPLVGFARLMEDFHEVRTAIGQVAKVLNNPPEVRNPSEGMRPKLEGRIAFEGVTFTYPLGQRPALSNISFDIPPGTMVGLVGRSGSGKSTITRLLQGINREYSGAVKIDGCEMREINLAHLRRSLGVVLQDNFLFRGTIKENIISGRPGLTLEDAVRAARLAGAEEFIERMPQGYDTWIEEGSTNISGGQRQRLAIARALINNPRILILDEATSALDPESEALVNANLVRIGKGRTMVIVSHRLSSLVDCDLIMVMDRGQVIDLAPHDTLLQRCSIYRTLWNQQNRHIASAQAPALTQGE